MPFYQPTFNMSELNKVKGTGFLIDWKSKGLFESKLLPLHGAFLPNIFSVQNRNTI